MTQSAKRSIKSTPKTKKELVSIYAVGSMRSAGWTIAKIADKLKVSRASVNRWFKEYKKLNIEHKTPIEKDETAIRLKRLTKKGDKAGKEFWGCKDFPKCRGTVSN